MDDLVDRWNQIPKVTRALFASGFLVTLLAGFNFINPVTLAFMPPIIYSRFEIWRIITPFLYYGPLGFGFLINMVWLLQYGTSLESLNFNGKRADYVYFLLFSAVLILLPAYALRWPFGHSKALLMVLIYYWARKNENQILTFWFGIRFKALYLPWVLIGFNVLMGGTPVQEIAGVVVGHLYFFLVDIYPLQTGSYPLTTPAFLVNLFNEAPQPGVGAAGAGGYNWGRGYNLQ